MYDFQKTIYRSIMTKIAVELERRGHFVLRCVWTDSEKNPKTILSYVFFRFFLFFKFYNKKAYVQASLAKSSRVYIHTGFIGFVRVSSFFDRQTIKHSVHFPKKINGLDNIRWACGHCAVCCMCNEYTYVLRPSKSII